MCQCCGDSGDLFAAIANRIHPIVNSNYPTRVSTSYVVKINAPNAVAVHLTVIPCNPCATGINSSKFSIIKCGIQLPSYASPAAVNSIQFNVNSEPASV